MKRSLPLEQDDDSPSSVAALGAGGNSSESSYPSTIVSTPPTKIRRQNIVSVLRKLVNSNSEDSNGPVKDTTMEESSYLPSPPKSPSKSSSKSAAMDSSTKPKSGFTHRLHKMNTLFRKGGKGKAKGALRSLQSVDMTEATQVVNDEVDPDESSPTTNTDSSLKSSSNSNSHSGISPSSTGKTSMDSKSNPSSSGKEKDPNDSAEKKQQHDAGTVVNRRNPPRTYSSLETHLAPIQETALDGTTTTILTVERAAAAKIYLETYFNTLLSSTPSPRSVRRDKLEADIKRRLDDDENFTPEEQEKMRRDFYSRETQHLRESRTLKTRSILSRAAEKGNPAAKTVEDDYEVLKILGKGSFGVVRLVKEKGRLDQHISDGSSGRDRKQVYAMKVIRKSDMLRTSQEGHLRAERDFLVASEGSAWIVPLVASFQDAANLYLVMEYMPGGDFLGLLIRENILHETVARFYIAEMIVCIEEAHALKCIHRDVKPDNFLISASGHLKISDFGLAFDGHWSHDMAYYNSHRYSLVHKLGISVEGDKQDKEEARSVQATLKWTGSIMTGIEKHNKKDQGDGEPLLN